MKMKERWEEKYINMKLNKYHNSFWDQLQRFQKWIIANVFSSAIRRLCWKLFFFGSRIPVLLQIQLANTKARKRCWVTLKFNERLVKWTSLEFWVPENQSTNLRQSIWHVPWTQYDKFLGSNSCGGLALEGSKAYSRFRKPRLAKETGVSFYDSKMTQKHMDTSNYKHRNWWTINSNPEDGRIPCLHRLCEFQLNSSLLDVRFPRCLGKGETWNWWHQMEAMVDGRKFG